MGKGFFFAENALGALLRARPARALTYGGDKNYGASAAAQAPAEAEFRSQGGTAFPFSPRFFVVIDGAAQTDAASRAISSLEAQSYRNFSFGSDPKGEDFDYLLYISEGDMLALDALYRFACAVNENRKPDMLFADEDVTGADGVRHAPQHKPDFSEITLLSFNCVGRPLAVSRAIHERCGGLSSPGASGEYAYALRCAAKSRSIAHIPRVLYARRVHLGDADPFLGQAAIGAYLKEKRIKGYAVEGLYEGSFRTAVVPRKGPSVAIILVAEGALAPLRRLLESLEENTAYGNYSVAVADMGHGEPRFQTYLELLQKNGAATVVSCAGLSHARAYTAAARAVKGDALLFLREDAEIVSSFWLDALLEQLFRRGVGAVGGKLVTEDNRIACGPYRGETDDASDMVKNLSINAIRGASALDGGCFMVRRKVFSCAGGFSETEGGDAFAALCESLTRRGLSLVYTPFCRVRLHEPRRS